MFSYDSSFLVLPLFPERFIGINIEAWLRIFVLMENFSWTWDFGRISSKMTASLNWARESSNGEKQCFMLIFPKIMDPQYWYLWWTLNIILPPYDNIERMVWHWSVNIVTFDGPSILIRLIASECDIAIFDGLLILIPLMDPQYWYLWLHIWI